MYVDSLGELAAVDVAKISNDPRDPMPSSIVAMLLGAIDRDFVSRLLGALGTDSPFVATELRHLGEATRVDVPEVRRWVVEMRSTARPDRDQSRLFRERGARRGRSRA